MAAARAADNDVLLKALSYGLEESFWPSDSGEEIGVLGAARFVLAKRLASGGLRRGGCEDELEDLLARAEILEPDEDELDLAARIERRAAEIGLDLDGGESQLAAICALREIPLLETGDKRAIAGFEPLAGEFSELAAICGRIRCLEQIAHRLAADEPDFDDLVASICGEPDVDRSLSICFSCLSDAVASQDGVLAALRSYISDLRTAAPTVLEPGP